MRLLTQEEKNVKVKLGQKIRFYRQRQHISQEVLAEKLDRSIQFISAVENGKGKIDDIDIFRICKICNIHLNDLYDVENSKFYESNNLEEFVSFFCNEYNIKSDRDKNFILNFLKYFIKN